MVIDFRKNSVLLPPVIIKGSEVERISSYKYLGVVINNNLTWDDHVDVIVKKLHSRLHCLRKLSTFSVRSEILKIFYDASIWSVWRYCLICWGGNVCKKEKDRTDRIIEKAVAVVGVPLSKVDPLY